MRISLIAALDEDDVIGRDGGLPWHLPDDLRRFRRLTMGHHVIVGRRTYESIGRALPGRTLLVLSRRRALQLPEGVCRAAGLAEALEHARAAGEEEAFVAGGASVYRDALPLADRIYLTRVHARVGGDVRFPPLSRACWREVAREEHAADEKHAHAFSFLVLDRRPADIARADRDR